MSVDMLARVVVTNIPEAAHNMARRSDVDCTENLCAFCDNSSTFEFCLFPCLKGTCAQHALEVSPRKNISEVNPMFKKCIGHDHTKQSESLFQT